MDIRGIFSQDKGKRRNIIIFTGVMLCIIVSFIAVNYNISKDMIGDRFIEGNKEDGTTEVRYYSPALGISGGLYAKDKTLKQLGDILEVCDRACEIMNHTNGAEEITVLPSNIIALSLRENAGRMFNRVIKDASLDIKTNLIYSNPICGKGSDCIWLKHGVSHFIGGSVSGGQDLGNPYIQTPYKSSLLYGIYGGDHALGYIQTEITSLDYEFVRAYPIGNYYDKEYDNSVNRWEFDDTLGFIRPNIAYIPDEIINVANHLGKRMEDAGFPAGLEVWNQLQSQSWFSSLSDIEKAYCQGVILEMSYMGGGGVGDEYANIIYGMLQMLYGLKADGRMERICDIFDFATMHYKSLYPIRKYIYHSNYTIGHRGNMDASDMFNKIISDALSGKFGEQSKLGAEELKRRLSVIGVESEPWFNVYQGKYRDIPALVGFFESCGVFVYEKWKFAVASEISGETLNLHGDIESGHQEDQGNQALDMKGHDNLGNTFDDGELSLGVWLDYIGSGKFKPIDNSSDSSNSSNSSKNYYSDKEHGNMLCTVYEQTSSEYETYFSKSNWGDIERTGSTLEKAGCGAYATAFAITNLTGKLVTPEDLMNKKTANGNYIITSLAVDNNDIKKAAFAYGLEGISLDTSGMSDKQFEKRVISELKDGGMIISVFWSDIKFIRTESHAPWHKLSDYENYKFPWYTGQYRYDSNKRIWRGGSHFMAIRGYNQDNNKLRVYSSIGSAGRTLTDVGNVELPASLIRQYIAPPYQDNLIIIKLKKDEHNAYLMSSTDAISEADESYKDISINIVDNNDKFEGLRLDYSNTTQNSTNLSNYNYISYIGTGRFPDIGSAYYNPSIGAIWYSQVEKEGSDSLFSIYQPEYIETIRSRRYITKTYGNWGCPAYAMAMILSNMLGTQILPNQVPGTTKASGGWKRDSHNITYDGLGFVTSQNFVIPAVNAGLEAYGYKFKLKSKLLTRSQLRNVQNHLYEWLDKGAMLLVRVSRTERRDGDHFVAVVGYDRHDEYNGYYGLTVLNSYPFPYRYGLMDSVDNQRASARHMSEGGGLAEYVRNYYGYSCLVIWRTDMASMLPGLN